MIEETAHVTAIEGDFAWVETQRQTTCGGCVANKGCGTATLQKVLGQRRSRLRAANRVAAGVGDEVVIGIHESALVWGSFMVYILPLLSMVAAALVGEQLAKWVQADSEITVVLSGVLGLLGGFAWVRHFARKISNDERFQAVILRKQAQVVIYGAGMQH